MLSVYCQLAGDLSHEAPVRITEQRGSLTYDLHRGLFLPEGVAALNAATAGMLAGGQWFQLWKGEIISMASPEIRGFNGRIHRGSVADEEAGPRHR